MHRAGSSSLEQITTCQRRAPGGPMKVGGARGGLQKLASLCQALVARAAGEEPVVADAVEALGQDVEEEAADELVRAQRHGGVAARPLDPVVLDLEGDARRIGGDQAAV